MIEVRVHIEPLNNADFLRRGRITILRGQLTILRMRAEQGITVSVECLARTERLAHELEAEELAA